MGATTMKTQSLLFMFGFLGSAAAAIGQAPGAMSDAEAARVIDQPLASLTVRGAALGEALADVGRQAGVEIVVDEAAAELLPWGAQTAVQEITVQDATVRQLLGEMLPALGLRFEIVDGRVKVLATEPLKRINRRATWDELAVLQRAASTPYTPDNLAGFKLQFRITSKVDAKSMLEHQLARAGQGTVAEMLETATGSLGWVWLPVDDAVVIRTMQAQIANKLSRRISVRYVGTPLARILLDLADKAETAFVLEPGMMVKLPANIVQGYSLSLDQASIRQALELICAETGLKYEIEREIVRIGLSEALEEGGRPGGTREFPYVGKIAVPAKSGDYTLEFLIRRDELPPDILDARNQMVEEIVQQMRQDMAPGTPMQSPDAPDP